MNQYFRRSVFGLPPHNGIMPDLFQNLMGTQAIKRDHFTGKTGQMFTTLGAL